MLYDQGFALGYNNQQNGNASLSGNYVYSTNPLQSLWFQSITANNNTFIGKASPSGANISM